jgi:hypothetical protein
MYNTSRMFNNSTTMESRSEKCKIYAYNSTQWIQVMPLLLRTLKYRTVKKPLRWLVVSPHNAPLPPYTTPLGLDVKAVLALPRACFARHTEPQYSDFTNYATESYKVIRRPSSVINLYSEGANWPYITRYKLTRNDPKMKTKLRKIKHTWCKAAAVGNTSMVSKR